MVCNKYSTKKRYKAHCIVLALINMRCLDKIAEIMSEIDDDLQLGVHEIKDYSIVLKGKKSYELKDIKGAFLTSVQKFISGDIKHFTAIIEENYEFEFDKSMIDMELINDFVDFSKSGKFVYIDIDE